jgi:HNH endonuclease/AP2 domain
MDAARLRELFAYDEESGRLIWRVKRRGSVGIEPGVTAGAVNTQGYVSVGVDGKRQLAHRIIWCLLFGVEPPHDIDHINGNRADNRRANLRMATRAQNRQNTRLSKNNSSGVQGVTWDPERSKWATQIMVDRKNKHLGRYETLEEAALVRRLAEEKYHPFRKESAHVASN